jgi:hypothetical protein
VHETGHQAAALLGLVESLRPEIQRARRGAADPERAAWRLFERWISEVVADVYSIARVGVSSTMGLIGLVSLPRAFVFRITPDDPHPFAWIRVQLSCAFGDALYPHPQWRQLAAVWNSLYPVSRLPEDRVRVIRALLATTPALVGLVLGHRPAALRGRSFGEVIHTEDRSPDRLLRRYEIWTKDPTANPQNAPSARVCRGRAGEGQRPAHPGGRGSAARAADLVLGTGQHPAGERPAGGVPYPVACAETGRDYRHVPAPAPGRPPDGSPTNACWRDSAIPMR